MDHVLFREDAADSSKFEILGCRSWLGRADEMNWKMRVWRGATQCAEGCACDKGEIKAPGRLFSLCGKSTEAEGTKPAKAVLSGE